jgi:hypothetical protein
MLEDQPHEQVCVLVQAARAVRPVARASCAERGGRRVAHPLPMSASATCSTDSSAEIHAAVVPRSATKLSSGTAVARRAGNASAISVLTQSAAVGARTHERTSAARGRRLTQRSPGNRAAVARWLRPEGAAGRWRVPPRRRAPRLVGAPRSAARPAAPPALRAAGWRSSSPPRNRQRLRRRPRVKELFGARTHLSAPRAPCWPRPRRASASMRLRGSAVRTPPRAPCVGRACRRVAREARRQQRGTTR